MKKLISWLMITVMLAVLLNVVAMPKARAENKHTSVQMLRPRRLLLMSVIQNEPAYIPAKTIATEPPEYNIQKFTNPGGEDAPDDICPNTQSAKSSSAAGLTKSKGVHQGPSGREKWYNLPMGGVIKIMRGQGFSEEEYPYWIRDDGCKMFGDYIMLAANTFVQPRGTILETSLGLGMICDHCVRAEKIEPGLLDIAVNW